MPRAAFLLILAVVTFANGQNARSEKPISREIFPNFQSLVACSKKYTGRGILKTVDCDAVAKVAACGHQNAKELEKILLEGDGVDKIIDSFEKSVFYNTSEIVAWYRVAYNVCKNPEILRNFRDCNHTSAEKEPCNENWVETYRDPTCKNFVSYRECWLDLKAKHCVQIQYKIDADLTKYWNSYLKCDGFPDITGKVELLPDKSELSATTTSQKPIMSRIIDLSQQVIKCAKREGGLYPDNGTTCEIVRQRSTCGHRSAKKLETLLLDLGGIEKTSGKFEASVFYNSSRLLAYYKFAYFYCADGNNISRDRPTAFCTKAPVVGQSACKRITRNRLTCDRFIKEIDCEITATNLFCSPTNQDRYLGVTRFLKEFLGCGEGELDTRLLP